MRTSELIVADFSARGVAMQVGDSSSSTIVAVSGRRHHQNSDQGCGTLGGKRIRYVICDFRCSRKIGITGGNLTNV